MSLLLLLGVVVMFFGFLLSLARFMKCLMMVENFKVLLLFMCLLGQKSEMRILFLSLMVIFTVEMTLCLVVLTRLWRSSDLLGSVGL